MFLTVASASDDAEFDAAGSPTSWSRDGFDLVSAAASPAAPPPPPPQLAALSTSIGSSAGKEEEEEEEKVKEKGERRQFAAIARPQVSLAEAVLSAGKSAGTLAQLGLLYQIRGDFEVRSFFSIYLKLKVVLRFITV